VKHFFVDLNHLDLMSVSGKDSGKFLQGQLTCNIDALNDPGACPGAACDNKGRVLSSFYLWKLKESYFLEMSPGLSASLASHLGKYMVFYQSSMGNAAPLFRRYGVCGSTGRDILRQHFVELPLMLHQVIRQGDEYLMLVDHHTERYEYWYEAEVESVLITVLKGALPEASYTDWQRLDMQAGIYHVDTTSTGLHTPQVLNYDINGHVDFNKGCYTGQEIVARMHYRGKAKRRLHYLSIDTEQCPLVGSKVISATGKGIGELISVIPAHTTDNHAFDALAIIEIPEQEQELRLDMDKSAKIRLQTAE